MVSFTVFLFTLKGKIMSMNLSKIKESKELKIKNKEQTCPESTVVDNEQEVSFYVIRKRQKVT